jgi:hypothetical protein
MIGGLFPRSIPEFEEETEKFTKENREISCVVAYFEFWV